MMMGEEILSNYSASHEETDRDLGTFLEHHRRVLTEAIVDALTQHVPDLSVAELEQDVHTTFTVLIAARHEAHADQSVRELAQSPLLNGLSAPTLATVIGIYRTQFLTAGLQAVKQLGPAVTADLQGLIGCLDRVLEELLVRQSKRSAPRESLDELRRSQHLLQGVIDNNPSGISVVDRHRRILLVNHAIERFMGHPRDAIIGKLQTDFYPQEVVDEWAISDHEVFEQQCVITAENIAPMSDGDHIFISVKFSLLDDDGYAYAVGNIITDITEQRRAEAERQSLQEQIIEAQQAALRELSTPLIPLAKGIVAMPLIGAIDSIRAQQIVETLLSGVAEHHARMVILDITGVSVVDTQVASAMIRAAKAVRLPGAKVMLTGIRPEVAQTIIGLGIDFTDITTRRSLEDGIASALRS